MFGWSSPYKTNVQPNNWHKDMFTVIDNRLDYLIDRIMAKQHKTTEHDELANIISFSKQFNLWSSKSKKMHDY